MTRTDTTRPIVIKLGGQPASARSTFASLAAEIGSLVAPVAVVHGGGKEVSDVARALSQTPRFENGVRITTLEEMDTVEMVLSGLVNKRLVRWFLAEGINAVGICGADANLLVGSPLSDSDGSVTRTASVEVVSDGIVSHLFSGGYVPVIAPPGSDGSFQPVNINADEAAMNLSQALEADALVFLSDVEGVLAGDRGTRTDVLGSEVDTSGIPTAGSVIGTLTRELSARLIAEGTISGGMIPKVRGSLAAISGGVGQVIIGKYDKPGDLGRLIDGVIGTRIVEEE